MCAMNSIDGEPCPTSSTRLPMASVFGCAQPGSMLWISRRTGPSEPLTPYALTSRRSTSTVVSVSARAGAIQRRVAAAANATNNDGVRVIKGHPFKEQETMPNDYEVADN